MGIKVENLNKSNGVQSYTYTYDVTNKELVNDEFFNQIGFINRTNVEILTKQQLFYNCDTVDDPFFSMARDIVQCPVQVEFQINDGFKFAQASYRFVDQDFTWFCTNIYQDQVKITFGTKGTGMCEINDTIDMTDLIRSGVNYIATIVGSTYDDFFGNINSGLIYCLPQASLQAGIINNAFSELSYSVDSVVVPTNFKKAIDNNEVFDISLQCTVDGKFVIGRVQAQHKRYSAWNQGAVV